MMLYLINKGLQPLFAFSPIGNLTLPQNNYIPSHFMKLSDL